MLLHITDSVLLPRLCLSLPRINLPKCVTATNSALPARLAPILRLSLVHYLVPLILIVLQTVFAKCHWHQVNFNDSGDLAIDTFFLWLYHFYVSAIDTMSLGWFCFNATNMSLKTNLVDNPLTATDAGLFQLCSHNFIAWCFCFWGHVKPNFKKYFGIIGNRKKIFGRTVSSMALARVTLK